MNFAFLAKLTKQPYRGGNTERQCQAPGDSCTHGPGVMVGTLLPSCTKGIVRRVLQEGSVAGIHFAPSGGRGHDEQDLRGSSQAILKELKEFSSAAISPQLVT